MQLPGPHRMPPAPRPCFPAAWRKEAGVARPSAARDRRDDGDGAGVGDGRVDALVEADVLLGHEHVDETAELAAVVEDPVAEPGVGRVQALQDLADGAPFDADL